MGRLRESYWQDASLEFARRLRSYSRLEIIEVPEARIKDNISPAEERMAKQDEANGIIEKLKRHSGPVIVLDRMGKNLDSPELAACLQEMVLEGKSEMAFIIGGALGLAPEVLKRADLLLSFSRMTFPHQMMRIILLEQIYRSFRIMHHEPYHK